ncbi:hypothetical protein ACIBF1_21670 [Spirillospora sp. NPDC050679]
MAVGCAGGWHRTATVGGAVAERLAGDLGEAAVVLVHRDLDKDVIAR